MNLLRVSLHAQGCNARPSDLIYGPPSPLSVYLGLRAWAGQSDLGEIRGLALAIRRFSFDKGRRAARPLQNYGDPNKTSFPPLFDEHRADVWLDVAFEVDASVQSEQLSSLAARWKMLPFLGGTVRDLEVSTWRQKEDLIGPWHATHWLVVDATPFVRSWAQILGAPLTWEQCAQAIMTSHLPIEEQQAVDAALSISAGLRHLANQRRLRLTPLGYRRLSPWGHPPGARTAWRNGRPQTLQHAYAESIYGAVHWRRVGRPVLTDGTPWWWVPETASTHDSPIVFSLKGVGNV